jgi:hypothetical protein
LTTDRRFGLGRAGLPLDVHLASSSHSQTACIPPHDRPRRSSPISDAFAELSEVRHASFLPPPCHIALPTLGPHPLSCSDRVCSLTFILSCIFHVLHIDTQEIMTSFRDAIGETLKSTRESGDAIRGLVEDWKRENEELKKGIEKARESFFLATNASRQSDRS